MVKQTAKKNRNGKKKQKNAEKEREMTKEEQQKKRKKRRLKIHRVPESFLFFLFLQTIDYYIYIARSRWWCAILNRQPIFVCSSLGFANSASLVAMEPSYWKSTGITFELYTFPSLQLPVCWYYSIIDDLSSCFLIRNFIMYRCVIAIVFLDKLNFIKKYIFHVTVQ